MKKFFLLSLLFLFACAARSGPILTEQPDADRYVFEEGFSFCLPKGWERFSRRFEQRLKSLEGLEDVDYAFWPRAEGELSALVLVGIEEGIPYSAALISWILGTGEDLDFFNAFLEELETGVKATKLTRLEGGLPGYRIEFAHGPVMSIFFVPARNGTAFIYFFDYSPPRSEQAFQTLWNSFPVNLASTLYDRGDCAAALAVLESLAEQGDISAQCILGGMYAVGLDIPQDYVQAYKWFSLAAATGEDEDWADISEEMTPEQIAEARRLAREWEEAHGR